jgi:hypothetical protein
MGKPLVAPQFRAENEPIGLNLENVAARCLVLVQQPGQRAETESLVRRLRLDSLDPHKGDMFRQVLGPLVAEENSGCERQGISAAQGRDRKGGVNAIDTKQGNRDHGAFGGWDGFGGAGGFWAYIGSARGMPALRRKSARILFPGERLSFEVAT